MALDLLVSNWYVFLAFLEHLEGRFHMLHLLHDCVPPQGFSILFVFQNGFFDCVGHAYSILVSLDPIRLRLQDNVITFT